VSTFCLLHGDWHDGECWQPVAARLRARGHDAVAPDLPFDDPQAGYGERVRPALDALEGVGGHVVVVGHSVGSGYAPLVAVASPGSLLVHLCPRLGPFPPPPGAPAAFRSDFRPPAADSDGTTSWDPEAAVAAMYRRLPPDVARATAERLHPATSPPGDYPLEGHPDVATALVYASDDEIFEPEWQRFMARELLGVEPTEIPGGHFPMLERPDALADLLVRLADEHEAR
jgi:pimeloyl-ACP methyl ester carboxylesterase